MRSNQTLYQASVVALRDLTPSVREFEIQPASGRATSCQAGVHLQVGVLVNGKPQIRSYSLVGLPDGQSFRIAVKRMNDGRGGSRAMWRLSAGDRLPRSAPCPGAASYTPAVRCRCSKPSKKFGAKQADH